MSISCSCARSAVLLTSLCLFVSSVSAQETITFNSLPTGQIVSSVMSENGVGPIAVSGAVNHISGNAAVIFDSSNPSPSDPDLGSPNNQCNPAGPGVGVGGVPASAFANCAALDKLLIVADNLIDVNPADGLVDSPDDAPSGDPRLTLNFSAVGPVTLHSITILDIDQNPNARIYLYTPANGLITSFAIPNTGDNGKVILSLGPTGNVGKIVIYLKGSGGVDNLIFSGPPTTQPVTGACCLPDGSCIDDITSANCTLQNGIFQGVDSLCSGVTCPQPKGACCLPNGSCVENKTAAECSGLGGTYQGDNST